MANVDLHGVEFRRIDSPLPPLAVGLTTVVGLVGAAPDAAGEKARLVVGAGNSAIELVAKVPGESGDDIDVSLTASNDAGVSVDVSGGDVAIEFAKALNASTRFGGPLGLVVTAAVAGAAGNDITIDFDQAGSLGNTITGNAIEIEFPDGTDVESVAN